MCIRDRLRVARIANRGAEVSDKNGDADDDDGQRRGAVSYTHLDVYKRQDKPCLGISTLEAMAENIAHLNGLVVGAMDARRAQVYNAEMCIRDSTFSSR